MKSIFYTCLISLSLIGFSKVYGMDNLSESAAPNQPIPVVQPRFLPQAEVFRFPLLGEVLDDKLEQVIEKIIRFDGGNDFQSRVMHSSKFCPQGVDIGDIHESGHLWPSKYREFLFKHGLLNSLIDVLTNNRVELSRSVAGQAPYLHQLLIQNSDKNQINELGGVKANARDTELATRAAHYFKLFDAFVRGMQHNQRLLLLGSRALKGKIIEERRLLDHAQKDNLDLLYDGIMTVTNSAVAIYEGIGAHIAKGIPENKTPEAMEQYFKTFNHFALEIEEFFTNYQPRITGLDIDSVTLTTAAGEEDVKHVPRNIKKAAEADEA